MASLVVPQRAVLLFALLLAAPAAAGGWDGVDVSNGPHTTAEQSDALAAKAQAANEQSDADVPIESIDWSELNKPIPDLPQKSLRAPSSRAATTTSSWSRNDRPDGSSAVGVKSTVTPFWDTQIGADMTVVEPITQTLSEMPADAVVNGHRAKNSSGSAWASITAPGVPYFWDKTSIEARMDPAADQGKLGTTFSKSLPFLSDQFSLTLLQGYRLTEQALPIGGGGSGARTVEIERTAKINVNETGTSVIAGQSLSTADDKWLSKVGAEQKLFGGVTVSGIVSETASGFANKSIAAGFKKTW